MARKKKDDIDIDTFLAQEQKKDLLRFSTAGSVDDGKSTLIGRLLVDSKHVYKDQIDSVRGSKGNELEIDYANLLDGLKSEREQGITIDVAYRYFSTPKRKFIIADTPGHEQYTRNMATGASSANLSIILIDARHGVLTQSRRHAFITSLLGVPHMLIAVNKMDLMDYDEKVYNDIKDEFSAFAAKLNMKDIRFIPVSALKGDNVVERSTRMPWYRGESLMEMLESVYIGSDRNLIDLRFPVQYVQRPNLNFRGYCGMVESGIVRKGDRIKVMPSGKESTVSSIVTFDGKVREAYPPQSVTLTLADEIDISRGDMLVHPANTPRVERRFEAMVVWMGESPLDPDGSYFIKHTTQTIPLNIDDIRYRVDVNTLKRKKAGHLKLNEIGRVAFTAARPVYFDPYQKNRATGSFIIIDRVTNSTVGAAMIIDREPSDELPSKMLKTAKIRSNMKRHQSAITPAERKKRMKQRPVTIWLTGLVSSGKTDLSYHLERYIFETGGMATVLDGENIRLGLNRDLDFSTAGRTEHLRRVGEMAKILNDSGTIAVCAFVSPDAATRREVAEIVGPGNFIEIHVSAPAEWCAKRDTSGLYKKAEARKIKNLPGVNAVYDVPAKPHLRIPTHEISLDEGVDRIVAYLKKRKIVL